MSSQKRLHPACSVATEMSSTLTRRQWLQSTAVSMVGLSTLNLWGCASPDSVAPTLWWKSGPFAPVLDEIDAQPLMMEGTLPDWLSGTYLRNGPNRVNSDHVLMGDGMLHAIDFENGQPTLFRNRYVQTPRLGQTDWLPPSLRDNASNIGIVYHHDKLLSLGELGFPFEVDRSTLETVGTYDFQGGLDTAMTGHPKLDEKTGELLFFGYSFVRPQLTFYAVNADGAVTQQTEIALRRPTLIHDFSITENYAVFYDAPMFFDRAMALQGDHLPVRWYPEEGARIGLVSRNPAEPTVRWYDVSLGFVFHTVNAYENERGQVVLHVIRYPEMWKESPEKFNNESTLWCYVIDPEMGLVSEAQISDRVVELPALDPRLVGAKADEAVFLRYRAPGPQGPLAINDGISSIDLNLGTEQTFEAPANIAFEEPTFVTPPEGAAGDGLILSFAYHLDTDETSLWTFDAASLSDGPIAKVSIPQRVPFGLHGTFIPSAR